jgi:hypothetical protein
MMAITREYLRERGACYSDDDIADLVPPEGVTPLEVCDADHVPPEDRLWVLLHPDFLSETTLRLLACDWAERAWGLVDSPDQRIVEVIDVARRHAGGRATREELDAARATASAAANAATNAAARDARHAANAAARDAWYAASAAAWGAAQDVARFAAKAAAWGAAQDVAWDVQIADVRAALETGR